MTMRHGGLGRCLKPVVLLYRTADHVLQLLHCRHFPLLLRRARVAVMPYAPARSRWMLDAESLLYLLPPHYHTYTCLCIPTSSSLTADPAALQRVRTQAHTMPRRGGVAKRQRTPVRKPRHPAVLKGGVDKSSKADAGGIVCAQVAVGERELKFARALADTEERVRTASLNSLRDWLTEHATSLDDTQLDRLWKALFYCLWMADKRVRVTAVIRDIIALEHIIGMSHMRALFRCMVREWAGIDRHRVDKYYELLNAAIGLCATRLVAAEEDGKLRENVCLFMKCVEEELMAKANKGGKGILMHVLDKWSELLFMPVLLKAASFSRNAVHWAWDTMLNPFFALLKSSDGRLLAVNRRFVEGVVAHLVAIATDDAIAVSPRARHDMLNRACKAIFAAAADPSTMDDARQRLYELRTDMKVVLLQLKEEAAISNGGDSGASKGEANKENKVLNTE